MAASAGSPRFDPEAPSTAHMWNLWLGGSNAAAADKARAAEIERACPQVPEMARNARLFTARAVAWAAAEGTGQFLELGCGVPFGPAVHEIARSVRPGARVAYIDIDPAVCDEADALLGDGERDGIAVACADLTRPRALLGRAAVRAVIDPGQPACALAVGVLHALTSRRARSVVAGYARLLAAGSVIAVTAPVVGDDLVRQRLARVHAPAARYDTTAAEIGGWLEGAGLELVPPGPAAARCLRPGWRDAPGCGEGAAFVLAAIGRKPTP